MKKAKNRESAKVVVAVSGYFNPIHVGHIDYLERAAMLGDWLVVIVNSDFQRELKGSKEFQSEQDRCKILKAIKWVDEVFLSVDKDRSVCKSLEAIRPKIFANGGDRLNKEIPERQVCLSNNITLVDGLGQKVASSSDLLKDH
jgi:cytidyltransferase-like protein